MQSWGHVELFSSNSLNVSKNGIETLQSLDLPTPSPDEYLTGARFAESYLEPLARHLSESELIDLKLGCRVISIGRGRLLKSHSIGGPERKTTEFRILISHEDSDGSHEEMLEGFDAVVDASGSYGNHNWMGKGGIPAVGERHLRIPDEICYTIPDLKGVEPALSKKYRG